MSKLTGTPFIIAILDLDHFKRLNDRYGHVAGDHALKAVASLVKRNMRQEDIFARIGGEEFAMIMTGGDSEPPFSVLDRLRALIEAQVIEYEGESIRLTASIGYSSSSPEDGALSTLLKRADDALYAAKRRGRNRVEYTPG